MHGISPDDTNLEPSHFKSSHFNPSHLNPYKLELHPE